MFNKRFLGLGFLLALVIVLIVSCASMAGACTTKTPFTDCVAQETTSVVDPPVASKTEVKFDSSICEFRGMRLWIDEGHGKAEYKNLKAFAEVLASPREPLVVCGGRKNSYSIDLAYSNTYIGDKNKAERKLYPKWTKRYAKRNHCTLYNENWKG